MCRIPVLCYHALHAPGATYAQNDHVALESDLAMIMELGLNVISARHLAESLIYGRFDDVLNSVVITMDDGPNVDYYDTTLSEFGLIKSMHRILKDADVSGTSFVIASPQARTELDRTCIADRDEWRDDWWRSAAEEGVLSIGNHSWDHNHIAISCRILMDREADNFHVVDDESSADIQIKKAQRYIASKAGPKVQPLFAYPYGHANDYLVRAYFPSKGEDIGIIAAFSTGGEYAMPDTNRWCIPRFVCGEHWQSPEDLYSILEETK